MLSQMTNIISDGHCAFSWVGPYGSGKSSLALALFSLFSKQSELNEKANKVLGKEISGSLVDVLKRNKAGTNLIPIVGRRESPLTLITEGLVGSKTIRKSTPVESDSDLIKILTRLAKPNVKKNSIIIFDEMGKALEHAARGYSDVYLFQQIAEIANRSEGRLLFIGVLHQSFTEYVNRSTQQVRDDWRKVQGRFIELPLSVTQDETISLISNAIQNDNCRIAESFIGNSKDIVALISRNRVISASNVISLLSKAWPLHPICTCLLGPISRRRFSQNQRSVFSFLSSSEPAGFQDFLENSKEALFTPSKLWDYYKSNLEPAILASPDGHRWTIAATVIDKCQALGFEDIDLQVLKTISIVHLFGKEAGMEPNQELLSTLFRSASLVTSLERLEESNLIVYKKQSDSYALFSGSDFDLDAEVSTISNQIGQIEYGKVESLHNIQPIVAKRHYHETGTLRWFDLKLIPTSELKNSLEDIPESPSLVGRFVLVVPDSIDLVESDKKIQETICEDISCQAPTCILYGYSDYSWGFASVVKELLATERVRETHPAIASDEIARRETKERIAELQAMLNILLDKAIATARWYQQGNCLGVLDRGGLSYKASSIAAEIFYDAPIIHNELLNRTKPSGSAVAAQNALLRNMVNHNGEARLGIEGYPAEGGLFDSLLLNTGLYQNTEQQWEFQEPVPDSNNNLFALWKVADELLMTNEDKALQVAELYDAWEPAPIGLKRGLMPFFAISYILSRQRFLGVYRIGIYQASLTDVFVDELVKSPHLVQLRWMKLNDSSRLLLKKLPAVLEEVIPDAHFDMSEPLSAARSLVALYDNLPEYTKRTNLLSKQTIHFRNVLKRAKDPNKLLFNELPRLSESDIYSDKSSVQEVLDVIKAALLELVGFYEIVLRDFRRLLLHELHVSSISDLKERAKNVYDLIGDKVFDGFASRLSRYEDSTRDLEGIISFASSKPTDKWIDIDIDKARVRIAELATQFLRAEAIARVKNRKDTRHAVALVIGDNGSQEPINHDFSLSETELKKAKLLSEMIGGQLAKESNEEIAIAALAIAGKDIIKKRLEG